LWFKEKENENKRCEMKIANEVMVKKKIKEKSLA